jgi:hypothetical protein
MRLVKRVYHNIGLNGKHPRRLVFVLGCQRSGTTMLVQCLEKDLHTKSYGQYGLMDQNSNADKLLYPDAHGPRLKSYDEIKKITANEKAPILILKPLRESQHAASLLKHFPGSKAIWVYRNYRDVANSHLVKWGEGIGIRKLRPIFDGDAGNHWASEFVSGNTRSIVKNHFTEDMSPADAAALYWYTRSVLFFDLNLSKNPNALLCKYENIVAEPNRVMRQIYQLLDFKYPGNRIVSHIHQKSVNRGKNIGISPEIEALCEGLMQKLDQVCDSQLADASEPS